MSASVALLLIGGLLLMVAIIGGGLELKELKIPKVERLPRVGCGIAGIVFVLLGFFSIEPPKVEAVRRLGRFWSLRRQAQIEHVSQSSINFPAKA